MLVNSQEKLKTMLMQNFGVTKAKSIVVCYGIFCSDQYKKSRTSLFILEKKNEEVFFFYQKDDNGEFWVEVLIVSFLDVVATLQMF